MRSKLFLIAAAMAMSCTVGAAVKPDEAARLGKDLTPWGAEKAGNKEGTIPAYTGGMPVDAGGAGWDSNKNLKDGRTFLPDWFKDEKPLFRITAANLSQYADNLSDTQQALLKNNPAYYMDIYPSHRVVNPPQYYIDASIKNATRCNTEQNGEALKGCKGGVPFPIPKTGAEVMWNAQVSVFYGIGNDYDAPSYYADRSGHAVMTTHNKYDQRYNYQDSRISLEDYEGNKPYSNIWYESIYDRLGPARVAGEGSIVKQFSNNTDTASWNYQPGNRRVRVNPNAAYDFPIASSGGAANYDEANLLSGRMDRFTWKLIGKQEMFLPYNINRMAFADAAEVMGPGYLKPEVARWERHRVWVVEATRKPGARHASSKRRFYIDEDLIAGAGMTDNYDNDGKVVRGGFKAMIWVPDYQCTMNYFWQSDVSTGIVWNLIHYGNSKYGVKFRNPVTDIGGWNNGPSFSDSNWSPDALSRRSSK